MIIQDITIDIFKDIKPGISQRNDRFDSQEYIHKGLVRILTDEGIEGNSFIYGEARMDKDFSRNDLYFQCSQILGLLKKELVGKDVSSREWLWNQFYVLRWWGRVDYRAHSAVDIALWDIAGKAANLPLYKYLGIHRDKVLSYASGPYFKEPEMHAQLAIECKERGYKAYKIKPGGGSVERVKEIATLVRKTVGDDMELMLDGQLCFNFKEAIDIGKHLEDLKYRWFEDPVRHNDFFGLEKLTDQLSIDIAMSDHPLFGFYEAADLISRYHGKIGIVRGDAQRGGITGLKKMCSLAKAYGINNEVHSWGNANLHVILSIDNCDYYEDMLHWKTGSHIFVSDGADTSPDGYVYPSDLPGLGYQTEWIKGKLVNTLT